MKIEIKLDNPNYCNGCPLLICEAEFSQNITVTCVKKYIFNMCRKTADGITRPEKCKNENGE